MSQENRINGLSPDQPRSRLEIECSRFGAWGMVRGALLKAAFGEEEAIAMFKSHPYRNTLALASRIELEPAITRRSIGYAAEQKLLNDWAGEVAKELNIPAESVKVKFDEIVCVWIASPQARLLDKLYPDWNLEREAQEDSWNFRFGGDHVGRYSNYYIYF